MIFTIANPALSMLTSLFMRCCVLDGANYVLLHDNLHFAKQLIMFGQICWRDYFAQIPFFGGVFCFIYSSSESSPSH